MIPKMGRDSQGSTRIHFSLDLLVHYVIFMLFSLFIHDLCFPSPFIILLLPLFVDLSYLLLLFVDLSYLLLSFVDLNLLLHTCAYYIVIIPFPRILVRQILSGFGGSCKPSMRP